MRTPRPQGVTQLSILYRENPTKENKDKIVKRVVQDYVGNGFSLNGKLASIKELASWLGITQHEAMGLVMRGYRAMGKLMGEKDMSEMFKAGVAMVMQMGLEDRGSVLCQLGVLNDAQDGTYKPFISDAVTRALDTSIKATNNLTNIIKLIAPSPFAKPLPETNPEEEKVEYLTTETAIGLLASNPEHLALNPSNLDSLSQTYLPGTPEVVADGLTATDAFNPSEAAAPKNKKKSNKHETMRVDKEGIDEHNSAL